MKKIVNDGIGGFNTVLYTGDGNPGLNITGVGFQPDFVWLKERNGTQHHYVTDSVRGPGKRIQPSTTNTEFASGALPSFDSDGFTVNGESELNTSGLSYVAWCFECPNVQLSWPMPGSEPDNEQINLNIGMSIVKYTGTGTAHAIAHNLGASPQFMIIKRLVDINNWAVYHHKLHSGPNPGDIPETMKIYLNLTNPQSGDPAFWNNTAPDSTTLTVGTSNNVNNSNDSHIAYLFTEIPGFSKFGSYEGNGGSNSVTGLGFRPEMLIIKNIDGANNWIIYDDTRPVTAFLKPDDTQTEAGVSDRGVRITDDGFDLTLNDVTNNSSGNTYIYAAFGSKGPALDIDLISNSETATFEPNSIAVFSLFTPREAVTLGTDLRLFVSRVTGAETQLTSNSSYWTEAPLSKLTDLSGDIDFITGEADVSAQNSGTALRYRFVGANLKKMDFSGTYLTYR